jgi:hypothetical protein
MLSKETLVKIYGVSITLLLKIPSSKLTRTWVIRLLLWYVWLCLLFDYPNSSCDLQNALVQAPDTPSLSDTLAITLLPALPSAWPSGSITAARIRGSMTLDLVWSNGRPLQANLIVGPYVRHTRQVQIWYGGKPVSSFSATPGFKRNLVFQNS